MNNWNKFSLSVLAAVLITSSTIAQDEKERKSTDKQEKTKEIVIRKKGDKSEKTTIIVDGDNITVNGKPVDEFKSDDITVFKRAPREPSFRRFGNGDEHFGPGNSSDLFRSHSNKAMLGVITQKADNGVRVTDVTKESGAEKAGLKKDDVIMKVGDKTIGNPEDLLNAIGGYKPADKVDITYNRNGKESKATVTLGENKLRDFAFNFDNNFNFEVPKAPIPPMEDFNFNFNGKPRIGLQIQDLEEGKGVKVKDVDEDSPASKAGIKEGDVITQINGKNVASVDDLRSEIRELKEGDTLKFTYQRGGKNQTAEVKIPKRLKSADL